MVEGSFQTAKRIASRIVYAQTTTDYIRELDLDNDKSLNCRRLHALRAC
nr:MAG TPA: hypothetical protein [Caudoviricetes sp.]